ncbi:MAG: hypothetical protein KGJ11_02055, partial [Candidatus Omnitrophica bacterium]|nr:hypothetical protein [Candidatus Omnitrophota bacterium]
NSTAVTNIPGVRAFYQATVSGKTNSFVPAGVYSYGVMTTGGQIIPLLLSVTDSPATVNGFLNIFAQAISGNVSAREQLSNILLSDNSNTYSQLLLMSAFTSAMDLNLYIIGADATPFFSRMNAWGNSTYQMAQQQPRTSDATLDLTLYNVVVEQWLSTYNLLPMLIAKNDFSDLNALTYNLGKLQSVVPYNGDPNPTIDQNIAGALSNTSAAINSQIVISNNGRINFQLSGFNGNYALGPNTQAQSVTNIPGISAFFQASIPGINNSFVPSGTYSYGVVTTGGIRISLVFSQSDNPSTVYSFLGIFYKAISGDVTAQQQLTNTLLNDTSNTYSQLLLMSAYTSAMELGLNISGTDSTPFFTRINAWGNSGISTEDYMSAALFGALVDQWLASYPSTFNQIATSPDKTDFNLVNGSFDTLLIPQYGNMDPIAGELYTFLDGISHRISSASQAMITIPSKPLTAAVKSTRKPLIKEQTPLGGIDFDRSYMQMRVFKKGNGVQMKFDPALVAKMKHDGFAGFIPFIVNMQTISNLNEFIGFKEEHS